MQDSETMLRLPKTEILWLSSLSRGRDVVEEVSTELCSKVKIICWMVAADKELFSWILHYNLQQELIDHLQCFLVEESPKREQSVSIESMLLK